MHGPGLTVLKFGGSVLRDESTLRRAVHEVYRWRRAGERVVAVVSALAGTTDALLARARRSFPDGDPHLVAATLAAGEHEAAALLGLCLDRAGVNARVLAPTALGLIAEGLALDADPVGLDVRPLLAALAAEEVVVVPGFAAVDTSGRTVVLGRGGSDLTALFIAARLGAERCRLIKDVDGLYERDPAARGPRPRRFGFVSYHRALALGGDIVHDKAVRFAREHGVVFELGRLGGTSPTRIGPEESVGPEERGAATFNFGLEPALARPLRVGLLGLGTVGGGVATLLAGAPERFVVTHIGVQRPWLQRAVDVSPLCHVGPVDPAWFHEVDVVVEALGGLEPARTWIAAALAAGAHVVTANKTVLAASGRALEGTAARVGRRLLGSAAVGGALPLLERLAARPDVNQITGILNGTSNFVLDALAAGGNVEGALAAARERGFAEADASRDLDGVDAAEKLVLAARALGLELALEDVAREPIDGSTPTRARECASAGHAYRQVARLVVDGQRVRASVELVELAPEHPLFDVRGERNGAVLVSAAGREERLYGRGAGRWPTAEAILGDLEELARAAELARAQRHEIAREFLRHSANDGGDGARGVSANHAEGARESVLPSRGVCRT